MRRKRSKVSLNLGSWSACFYLKVRMTILLAKDTWFFVVAINCLRARSSFSLSVSRVTVNVEYKYRYKLPFVLIRWYEIEKWFLY